MKKSIALAFVFCLLANSAFAQEVTVVGTGTDANSARSDARRIAVERVVGTFIASNTLVQNVQVISDEIYAKAAGFAGIKTVLQEGFVGGTYQVKAVVDVNTNADSVLINKLELIMKLKDPRITVVVFAEKDESGNIVHDEIAENAINDKLIEMGFSHVIDANTVAKLQNSAFLYSLYQNSNDSIGELGMLGVDYIVVGKSTSNASNVVVNGVTTQMVSGRASIQARLIKADTGDIFGSVSAMEPGLDGDPIMAAHKARANAGVKIAEQVKNKFRLVAVKTAGKQISVSGNADAVQALGNCLKGIGGVSNVYVREASSGKGLIEFDSELSPADIYQMLRANSSLGLILDGFTNNGFRVTIL